MRARRALTAPLLALLALAVPSTALLAAPATAGAATNRPAPVQAVHSVQAAQATPRAGMFCRTADAGKVVRTDKGLLCCDTAPGDARYRWRTVVK